MLSRAAERVYWAGRYLERAENTARIIQNHSHLLLDLPSEVGVGWVELVRIVGAANEFAASGRSDDRDSVLGFLLAERDSVSSLAFAVRMARDNVRNLRDLLPQESWENVNELHQFAGDFLLIAASGKDQFDILGSCIERCQQINGTLNGTMSHHSPHHFLTLGQTIERADMTSRIIEVAAAYFQENERVVRRFGSTLWTNVLKSVSGFQMYRQYRQPQVVGTEVVDFLLYDAAFPRAIGFCLESAKTSAQALPRSSETMSRIDDVAQRLHGSRKNKGDADDISRVVDSLQSGLVDVHLAIVDTWFRPEEIQ